MSPNSKKKMTSVSTPATDDEAAPLPSGAASSSARRTSKAKSLKKGGVSPAKPDAAPASGAASSARRPAASPRAKTAKAAPRANANTKGKGSTAGAPSATQMQRAAELLALLERYYPDAECALDYSTPTELLVATILSAQATDAGVNKVTPALFARFRTPADYAALASSEELEPWIASIGLYRNKAKAIHAAMQMIVNDFGGEVPSTMEDLLKLRGVARKTANVVLGNAFGINEGVVVDTHVLRLSERFGLTRHTDPVKVERDLMALFPRDSWTKLSHMLILHGRAVCKARGWSCAEHEICQKFCANVQHA